VEIIHLASNNDTLLRRHGQKKKRKENNSPEKRKEITLRTANSICEMKGGKGNYFTSDLKYLVYTISEYPHGIHYICFVVIVAK
jgi:hypothetical protein